MLSEQKGLRHRKCECVTKSSDYPKTQHTHTFVRFNMFNSIILCLPSNDLFGRQSDGCCCLSCNAVVVIHDSPFQIWIALEPDCLIHRIFNESTAKETEVNTSQRHQTRKENWFKNRISIGRFHKYLCIVSASLAVQSNEVAIKYSSKAEKKCYNRVR